VRRSTKNMAEDGLGAAYRLHLTTDVQAAMGEPVIAREYRYDKVSVLVKVYAVKHR